MIPVSPFFNLLYMPVCRAYARHVVRDRPADSIYRALCSLQFRRTHGFWPDFVHPRRFSEKLWSRMLHDRNPQLTMFCDKLRVRDYVARKAGDRWLVPLLWSGEDPARIPFERLPEKYVIKATHGCGYNIFVHENARLDKIRIRRQLSKWLKSNYAEDFQLGIEWGYRGIKPSIVIEEFVGQNGIIPQDYKFYCFSGRVEFLTRHFERFVNHKTRAFNRDYGPHEFRSNLEQYEGECPRPQNFETMVELAEILAETLDFIRVDLYNVEGRVLFGELTPYPGGVTMKFLPESMDYALGEKWKTE